MPIYITAVAISGWRRFLALMVVAVLSTARSAHPAAVTRRVLPWTMKVRLSQLDAMLDLPIGVTLGCITAGAILGLQQFLGLMVVAVLPSALSAYLASVTKHPRPPWTMKVRLSQLDAMLDLPIRIIVGCIIVGEILGWPQFPGLMVVAVLPLARSANPAAVTKQPRWKLGL